MGLDVYLYTRAEQEASDAFDKKYPEEWFETATPEEKEQWEKEWRDVPRAQDVPSEKYPDNINNRRYLRSSYNAGGFNRVVPEVLGDERFSYYGIFEPLGDLEDYTIKVDDPAKVKRCRDLAQECANALEVLRGQPVHRVTSERAVQLRPDLVDGKPDADWALRYFKEEREKPAGPFGGGYSNAFGSFFEEDSPLEVVAAMAGVDVLGSPCVHLVYKTELHESYIDSAHVLVEFCDELLELVEKDGCAYIHWSG